MKKLVAIGIAVLVLALVAGPAMAKCPGGPGCGGPGGGSDDLTIWNRAKVTNNVVTQANTGFNSVGGMLTCGKIKTGGALAGSAVYNFVNTSIVGGVTE